MQLFENEEHKAAICILKHPLVVWIQVCQIMAQEIAMGPQTSLEMYIKIYKPSKINKYLHIL